MGTLLELVILLEMVKVIVVCCIPMVMQGLGSGILKLSRKELVMVLGCWRP